MKRHNDLYQYTKELNILYVEDEQLFRKDIEDILSNLFKNVVSAKDGQEAYNHYLEYTKDDKYYFDIVLTDIYMPIIDGIELIDKIYKLHNHQVIVVVSAHNESSKLIKLINLGITNFIHKPFNRKKFYDIFFKISQDIRFEKEKIEFAIDKELHEYKKIVLEDKTDSLKDLLDNIAHHWRQPLSLISTIASGMQLEMEMGITNPDKNEKLLQQIIDTTMDMSSTITTLSNAMKLTQKKTFFNIKDIFETVAYLMKSKFEDENIIVIEHIENIEIHQVEHQIQQIFINLFNNAIDAMADNKRKLLFVDIFQKENRVHIEIKDNGVGIKSNIKNKLCEPYFTTKHKYHGTGLGLFVVNDLVTKEMNGILEFENVQYEYQHFEYDGTLVKVLLPFE